MAGHSKWANIKHKKAAADAKRGKVFSRIAKELTVTAREGGGDPSANITLRTIIQKARDANMPADNIDRAIKKGTGELDGGSLEEVVYEGYAQGGVGIIAECLTDNRNRTAAEVRHVFNKYNGSLAGQGSVSHAFQRKGLVIVSADAVGEDRMMEAALEAGVDDLKQEGESYEIITEPTDYARVVEAFREAEIPIENSELTMLPDNTMPVDDKDQAASLLRFIEALEDLDDVQNVYSNLDITDEILQQIEGED